MLWFVCIDRMLHAVGCVVRAVCGMLYVDNRMMYVVCCVWSVVGCLL